MTRCQPYINRKDPQCHVWGSVTPRPRQRCRCSMNGWPWIHAGAYTEVVQNGETIIYPVDPGATVVQRIPNGIVNRSVCKVTYVEDFDA